MDRPTPRMDAHARGTRPQPHESFVLPSRKPALDLCRSLLGSGQPNTATGPILLTGDAGVGKTWLCRILETEARPLERWVGVDLTPANHPAEFYRLINHELGLTAKTEASSGRIELIDFLQERQSDGERLTLVIDEAQNLAMPVWEEVRILANRLDRPGGFSRMILVGQTSLARRFSTRPFAAIEARLAAKIHLGPIDADEAAELVARSRPAHEWSAEAIEALHRDSGGNPRRILRKLGPLSVTIAEVPAKKEIVSIEPAHPEPVPSVSALVQGPLTGPARPPIRVDENMIEVGWSPEDPSAGEDAEDQALPTTSLPKRVEAGEEAVKDHYAALQAWREWTENQAKRTQPAAAASSSNIPTEFLDDEDEIEEDLDDLPAPLADRPNVRVEGEQKFAPFGQLFSRMAQSHEIE